MNILFITLSNISNINKSGIYTDLLRYILFEKHTVYVVYPKSSKNEEDINDLENLITFPVLNTTITKNKNFILKGVRTLFIGHVFYKIIQKIISDVKIDLVIYTTPPITISGVVAKIKKDTNAKSYLLLKDIFPQNAVDLHLFNKNSVLYYYFRAKEKKMYLNSDFIGCMSKANQAYILEHNNYLKSKIVEVCPNSIEVPPLKKVDINAIRKKYNLPLDKKIFVYGGNLGKPQGFDFILNALTSVNNPNVYFLIIGAGTEYKKVYNYLNNKKINSIELRNSLAAEDYEELISSCDVGMIFLDYRFTIPNFPSRLLSYLKVGLPVLAATDKTTDLGQIIEKNDFGFWCESNREKDFRSLIEKFLVSDLRSMGNNAYLYLVNNYSVRKSYNIIMSHFKN